MITNKDINALRGMSEKYYLLVKYLFLFVIVVSTFNTGFNLYISIKYANPNNPSITTAITVWNKEKALNETYTGNEHHSLIRLNNSILSLGVTILLIVQLLTISTTRKRNKRILSSLIEHGALKNE